MHFFKKIVNDIILEHITFQNNLDGTQHIIGK